MPFALLYSFEPDGAHAVLRGASGIAPGHAAAPDTAALDGPAPWPLGEVIRTGTARPLRGLAARFGAVPKGLWNDAPDEAMILPLATGADAAPRGALIAAVNPYRPRDGGFEAFLRLVARQIASAIVAIEAFEAERERAQSAGVLALEIEHRRRIEKHQNLLLDELNHRVKNTLASVQAMAVQSLKGADAEARDAFLARLFALSGQHDLLTLDNWEGASFEGVVRRALRPWREDGRVRFEVEGPPVHLTPKCALALGMAFHELASNAARHGALANDAGMVRVRWTADPESGRLKLCWQESGGPRVEPPARRGFGLRLVEDGLGREISGTVRMAFPPEGMVCEWDMKLP
jgi:two-component sensor histidine kinase